MVRETTGLTRQRDPLARRATRAHRGPVREHARQRRGLIHDRKALELRGGGALRLVVVADTHSQPDPRSDEAIAAERPDHILHAGDIGAPAVLDALARHAPVTAVRGNIDGQMPGVPDVVTLDVRDGEHTLLTILLLHIAVLGPKLRADAARLARAEGASIVACGHSHVPFIGMDRGIAVVNAGSIGPRRFHLPIVFAVVDVRREGVSMHHVSCETGARWQPGG
jgi:putative phosphoesterase